MGRKRIIVGAVAFALAVVTGVALAVVVPRLRDSRAAAPPVAPIAASLRLVTPAALVGQEAELLAAAVSRRPLARFELWSGGELVAEARPVTDGPRAAAALHWAPPSAGNHLLVLRAVDDLGHAAHAAPVRMRTDPLPEGALPLRNEFVVRSLVGRPGPAAAPADSADPAAPRVMAALEGCTLRISADAGSLRTLALFTAGPGQPGFQSLRYGDTGHSEATLPLAAGDVAVYALGYGGQDRAASPILSVAPPAECADSRWQGNVSIADGLLLSQPGPPNLAYLYLSVDGGPWRRVPAQDQTFIRRRNGVLDFSRVLPPLGAAKRIDVEAWSHDGTGAHKVGSGTLIAGQGEENFMPVLLGALPATDLDIVVKHTVGDFGFQPYETLERYGEIHAYEEVNPPQAKDYSTSSITIAPSGPDYKVPMRWKPKVLGITHGVWQVSVVPLGNAPLTSGSVLLSGTVPVTKLDFDLNFAPLVLPVDPAPALDEESAAAGGLKHADYNYGSDYADIVPQDYEAAKANLMAPYVDTGGPPAAPGTTVASAPPGMSPYDFVQSLHPEYLYVRIIPMAGAQPMDAISNTVTFRLYLEDPTPYVPPPPPTVDVQVEFQRPYLPNALFEYCVRVVENKFATPSNPGANPVPPGMGFYKNKYEPAPVGATVCPDKPPPDDDFDLLDFFESVIDGVVEFWDAVVSAFNYLKAEVVDLLVDLSACGEPGTPLWFVDADTCHDVAAFAVDATLMYFGIPPSLPNSSVLYATAKGQMVDAVYEFAGNYNISCGPLEEECKKQLAKMLDEVVAQAKTQVSKAAQASASSVGMLWLNPDIVVVPEPRGKLQPAIFTTTFTRKPTATDDAAVPEKASPAYNIRGVRNDWSWWDYDHKQQIEHTTVIGNPLVSSGGLTEPVLLRQLAPGESTTVVKVMDRPAIWFEPGADPAVKQSENSNTLILVHSDYSHWWVLMTGGATVTAYGGQYGATQVDSWTTTQLGAQP